MNILLWIIGLGLILFEMASGLGKVTRRKMAVDTMSRLGVPDAGMMAFGGLEIGAVGIIITSLFNPGGFNDKLVPWAGITIVILMGLMLVLQNRAGEPFAAKVGPLVVITLAITFLIVRNLV